MHDPVLFLKAYTHIVFHKCFIRMHPFFGERGSHYSNRDHVDMMKAIIIGISLLLLLLTLGYIFVPIDRNLNYYNDTISILQIVIGIQGLL